MVIVLDAEAAAHNALGFERYAPAPAELADEASVAEADMTGIVVEPSKDRKEYRREWMRRKRASDRDE